jgi:hypothetical protein
MTKYDWAIYRVVVYRRNKKARKALSFEGEADLFCLLYATYIKLLRLTLLTLLRTNH